MIKTSEILKTIKEAEEKIIKMATELKCVPVIRKENFNRLQEIVINTYAIRSITDDLIGIIEIIGSEKLEYEKEVNELKEKYDTCENECDELKEKLEHCYIFCSNCEKRNTSSCTVFRCELYQITEGYMTPMD